ncbi:MAG: anaerobic ribonucleoside-triphosphate reductase activating protein [Desulfobacteraceae bacterium]|nr:MAG: anaerobic ribonucleoside-triphosphate reductase activating protein [Desulfobacteraceae bacterium]
MLIGGIQKLSLIDYPGKISAVIFTQGCNFLCPYCHNPQLVHSDRFEKPMETRKVLEFLSTRVGRLDGVVLSGGEPTLQSDLADFIGQIKPFGFAVKLDTNGSRPRVLEQLLLEQCLDYVAMDLKAPPDKYKQVSGGFAGSAAIAESVRLLAESGVAHEFRTTFDPDLLDPKDLERIKAWAGASPWRVQERLTQRHEVTKV